MSIWPTEEQTRQLQLSGTQSLWLAGRWQPVVHCPRNELTSGNRLAGPAVVLSPGSTLVVSSGWQAVAASDGTLLLERDQPSAEGLAHTDSVTTSIENSSTTDPVSEAVFAQRLAAIATQMGLVLQQTALSVNVKQRRDFSCAIFDRYGRMLASAPHVPVHLGAMGATVRAAMAQYPALSPGDCVVTNNPYAGGSHLPDITVISGIFEPGRSSPSLFVANRAHHADIGGIAPGSMCVSATRLGDEGAIIGMLRMDSA
ncbi:MAG: hydantoinase B/oxoprolinase family protein, partial [Pirellulaceae bacterium]|nr:hydantoinase B/oxoprolinase family protein [Pirellulaceae bacterium]